MLYKKIYLSVFLFFIFVLPFNSIFGNTKNEEPSIVFVHLGSSLPDYLPIAIAQARLFNPSLSIYLIANKKALTKGAKKELRNSQTKFISCESLTQSASHKKFRAKSKLDKKFRKGFWTFTTERFFYLSAFLKKYNLSNIFHLENDVMLYTDLKCALPIFLKNYANKIGATFDNDNRCIPGFLYISNQAALEQFTDFIGATAERGDNDMQLFAKFQKQEEGKWIKHLPILTPEYAKDHQLISSSGSKGSNPLDFSSHIEEFHSIFDAAAIGQYLGGIDPRNGDSTPGFINEECIFNPSNFQFAWKADEHSRKIPIMAYKGKEYKINNLHIHSKNLKAFQSNL